MDQRGHTTSNNGGGAGSSALRDEAQQQLDELRQRASELNERLVRFIKERPATALLIAVGAGFLVGRILRS